MWLVWMQVVLQAVVPLGLLGWLAFGRHPSRLAWALAVALAGLYLVAIGLAGLWLLLPWYLPLVYGALIVPAAMLSFRFGRPRRAPPTRRRQMAGLAVRSTAVIGLGALTLHAFAGHRPPPATVNLAFPLEHGTYLVVNGGSNELVNAHLKTLTAERYREYRGQSHGVDVVELDARGLRAEGIAPHAPDAYVIFGSTVRAPCGGTVIAAVDGLKDLQPPATDPTHMAGNHVMLECDSVWVLLGHLRRGSVLATAGQRVRAGQMIGQVGNTGKTDEPHLHIHAQRPGSPDAPLSGTPLPITFRGRFPARNVRIQ
jgi:hypothetical protein